MNVQSFVIAKNEAVQKFVQNLKEESGKCGLSPEIELPINVGLQAAFTLGFDAGVIAALKEVEKGVGK